MAANRILEANTETTVTNSSNKLVWSGRIISALIILFLLADAIPKLLKMEVAVDGSADLGYPESTVLWIGLALLISTVLYAIPRTAPIGAILLTGYLGGATATTVRVEDPWFLFPVAMGVLVWVGLALRDARPRALISW